MKAFGSGVSVSKYDDARAEVPPNQRVHGPRAAISNLLAVPRSK